MANDEPIWAPPATLAELRLPPAFVADHCIRTLSLQGAMSFGEMAKHWRVPSEIAAQVIEPLKAAGIVETDSNRASLETMQRWRLSAAGQARIVTARARTWYAGPLPVSLQEFDRRTRAWTPEDATRAAVREALAPFLLEEPLTDQIGQAVASGASLALGGIAHDEQRALAEALSMANAGEISIPHALFAAGAVIRVFDARVHRPGASPMAAAIGEETDLLRSKESPAQWSPVPRPLVALTGGVMPCDVVPAYDEDARFYIAPAPLVAIGGLLAVCDAANSAPDALEGLARYWLAPARHGFGILLLRTGERIEVPWKAATLVFAGAEELPRIVASAVQYTVDASVLAAAPLRAFIDQRLPRQGSFTEAAIDTVAEALERAELATREAASSAARYLRDCSAYQGTEFALSETTMSSALQFAASHREPPVPRRLAA